MADIKIDVKGEKSPIPLIKFRKALKESSTGDILEVIGTHPASKLIIPMTAEALGLEVLGMHEKKGVWTIKIRG